MVKKNIVQRPVAQMPTGYNTLLKDLKRHIRHAQTKAALAANSELVMLYWQIGRAILERQKIGGWGAKVIGNLGVGAVVFSVCAM